MLVKDLEKKLARGNSYRESPDVKFYGKDGELLYSNSFPCFAFLGYGRFPAASIERGCKVPEEVETLVVSFTNNFGGEEEAPQFIKDFSKYRFRTTFKIDGNILSATFNAREVSGFEIYVVGSLLRSFQGQEASLSEYFLWRKRKPDIDPFICLLLAHFGFFGGRQLNGHSLITACYVKHFSISSGFDLVKRIEELGHRSWKEWANYEPSDYLGTWSAPISQFMTTHFNMNILEEVTRASVFNRKRVLVGDKDIFVESLLSEEGYEKHKEFILSQQEKVEW